ncbi:hypothetical protein [Micromonospora sp. HM5-17]|jgi:hypothetical protein|uniref:hypothetical protein n=1 Tax=Micromonospora sp. HM5-17 TaxID=2487710 RepID=UPI000F485458|nr:hypothetical protein [Micromonospora sp. HM5-17]ROT33107.1 hypothetical protein EF879_08235 [Micromonospora sp. HM5-17]
MQRAKVHVGFILLFLLSLFGLLLAVVTAILIDSECGSPSKAQDPACDYTARSMETTSLVLAIGSLTTMVAGVGFQVGRNVVASAGHAGFPATAPVAGPQPGSVAPSMPAPPSAPGGRQPYPSVPGPVSGPGHQPYA